MNRQETGRSVAVALGADSDVADAFASWFAHMWPDDNAALAFNAWVAARKAVRDEDEH